jgi:hypothetical protein
MSMTKTLTAKDTMLAKVLLASDLMPVEISKAGPHVLACQNLVTAFIDTQHQIFGKFLAMEEELDGYKKHIETLKRELNAACMRELDAEQVCFLAILTFQVSGLEVEDLFVEFAMSYQLLLLKLYS